MFYQSVVAHCSQTGARSRRGTEGDSPAEQTEFNEYGSFSFPVKTDIYLYIIHKSYENKLEFGHYYLVVLFITYIL